jgi:hypothetical protein
MINNMAKVLDMLNEGKISVDETRRRIITIDIGEDGWKINKQGFSAVGRSDDNSNDKHLQAVVVPNQGHPEWEHLRYSSPFCRWSRTLSY